MLLLVGTTLTGLALDQLLINLKIEEFDQIKQLKSSMLIRPTNEHIEYVIEALGTDG